MRSANEPVISAGVMIANVIWKVMKRYSGMVPVSDSIVTPEKKTFEKPPI
ncbi:Uncharacterised protein [Brucella abortus]|nr:hypothetical protein BR141012304_10821 [Brucella inopinata]SUW27223.1 Uncharacterised protein [Brucella abortus]